jgi:molybdopterin biosynthesis enzyme
MAEIPVVRRPRVAIISTGDEVVAPGGEYRPGMVFDTKDGEETLRILLFQKDEDDD